MDYNKEMDDKKNKLSVHLGTLSLLFLAAAISLLIFQNTVSEHSDAELEQMRENASTSAMAVSVAADQEEDSDSSELSEPEPSGPAEPVRELCDNPYRDSFLANPDMGAWLKIDGTVIDYPVMWTPRDETYYLERNFEGKTDKNGCLLLDTDSCLNPLTTNLIIHGHNMKSGAMFGGLMKYEDEGYYREHRTMTLYAEDREHRYEVIAVFRSQVYKKTDEVFKFYKFFQADTEEAFDDFYQNIKALSLYDTGVTAKFGDHFLTLSTCAYHVTNGRFVVVAKETEGGEYYRPFREVQDN